MESFYRAIFCFALLANPYAKTRRKMIQYCEIREKMTECTGQDITLHLLRTFLLFILLRIAHFFFFIFYTLHTILF